MNICNSLIILFIYLSTSSLLVQTRPLNVTDFVNPSYLATQQEDIGSDGNLVFDMRGIFSRCATPKTIALTFDDGPGSFLDDLLDILKVANVSATFFAVGQMVQVPKQAASLKRAHQEGHLIATHSFTHRNLTMLTLDEQLDELLWTNEVIANVIGEVPVYFRPPFGSHNTQLDNTVFANDLRMIMWNADPLDWKTLNATINRSEVRRVVNESEVDGVILLQHEIWQSTVNSTLNVIQDLKEAGYRFSRVDECLGLVPGQSYLPLSLLKTSPRPKPPLQAPGYDGSSANDKTNSPNAVDLSPLDIRHLGALEAQNDASLNSCHYETVLVLSLTVLLFSF